MIEIEKEKQAKKLERSLSGMFTTADKAPTYRDYLEEMTQGIPELGGKVEESDEGEDNAEDEAEEAGFSKETKPKTKQQRRKERLRKEKESLKLKAKKQRIELNNVFLVKTYKKEILAQERATELRQKLFKEKEILAQERATELRQ